MNFDFYFKRTCFRTMTLYYKTIFKPFFEAWKTKRNQSKPINDILIQFTDQNHPGLSDLLRSTQCFTEYIEMLKLLVFSHRHNKNDAFLTNLV
jgi:hypothetical protein